VAVLALSLKSTCHRSALAVIGSWWSLLQANHLLHPLLATFSGTLWGCTVLGIGEEKLCWTNRASYGFNSSVATWKVLEKFQIKTVTGMVA
jgi:hypothetical protein